MKIDIKRRQFVFDTLKTGASLSLSALVLQSLTGCTTLDQVFSVEKTDFENEVIIIGAGAAGLMAALSCKKKKIPYRLYEASHRVGGRIRSVAIPATVNTVSISGSSNSTAPVLGDVAPENLYFEMGISTVDERHRHVFDLCRDLNLELYEKKTTGRWDQSYLWSKDHFISMEKNRNEFEKIFQIVAAAQLRALGDRKDTDWKSEQLLNPEVIALDEISFLDLIKKSKHKFSENTLSYLQSYCMAQWGIGLDQVSALAVILHLDPENRGPAQFKLRGGFGNLTQTMFERSAGVIANHLVKTGYQLVEVEENKGRYFCTFQVTQIGEKESALNPKIQKIECQKLILALPVTQLAKVKWSGELESSMQPWTKMLMGDLAPQTKSFHAGEVKTLKNKWAVGKESIHRIEPIEEDNFVEILSAPGTISVEGDGLPGSLGLQKNPQAFLAWGLQKNIKGARWSQCKGNITQFQKWKNEFKTSGLLYFVGEFDSTTYPGTLEGALASSKKAIESLVAASAETDSSLIDLPKI